MSLARVFVRNTITRIVCLLLVAFSQATVYAQQAPEPPRYKLFDIISDGAESRAYGINSNGVVVGQVKVGLIDYRAFIWDPWTHLPGEREILGLGTDFIVLRVSGVRSFRPQDV